MIADGIAVKSPGALTLPLIRERVNNVLLVSDGDIEQAILMLLEIEKTVVEGAGAVGLAALADAAALLGKLGANIDEVQHQRCLYLAVGGARPNRGGGAHTRHGPN